MIKVVQIVIYGFWGLITLVFGLGTYQELGGPGIGFWSGTLLVVSATLLTLAAILALAWVVLASTRVRAKLLPKPKYRYINNYTVPGPIILLVILANVISSSADSSQAKKLGFTSEKDFTDAKRHKIYSVDEYSKYLADKKTKENAAVAIKVEQDRVAAIEQAKKDAECAKDSYCYYTSHNSAEYQCANEVEKLAKYKFEWTDKFYEKKFNASRWVDENKKIVQIFGNRATAQNGFGATQNVSYNCTFNADTGEILYAALN